MKETTATFPNTIGPGSTIGIAAPSGPVHPQLLQEGLKKLHHHGFKTRLAGNLSEKNHFLAGDRESRLQHTLALFKDDSVDAVLCARGGDGAVHLLPEFLDELSATDLKAFVGYSDITMLQMALYERFRWVSFSGPMLVTEMADDSLSGESINHLKSVLMKPLYMWNIQPPQTDDVQVLREGAAEGILLGGCLSLLCAMLGTPYLPDFKDAVLIIEDIDETPRSIDRMLQQLRIAGIFEKISGLILGHFAGCFPLVPGSDFTLEELVQSATRGYDFPVIADYPYGHQLRDRLTMPLGAMVRLQTQPVEIKVVP